MNNYIGEGICASAMALTTVTQANEYLQTIQIVICIVSGAIGVGLGIWKLIKTYKEAKKDGKITAEEKNELINEGIRLGKELSETIKKCKEFEEKQKNGGQDDRN